MDSHAERRPTGEPARLEATVRDLAADVPPRRAALPPQAIAGYEVLDVLGEGGMGVVYQARQVALNRLVALKMVLNGANGEERERFRAEAETVARLRHPNIVQVYEVGEHDGLPFMALEYVEGGSLADALAERPLAPRQAARLVETLARAVQYAHSAGVVHRDLKPANILLSAACGFAGANPKIADFGLARRLDQAGRTHPGIVVGTPSYMAPEQAQGQKDVGPLVDVYALGAILYECLTGQPPFHAESLWEVLGQVRQRDPAPPRSLRPDVPRDLETICLKCLGKEPHRRYTSAQHLADDLARFAAHEPIQARPVGTAERAVKWARRRPAAAALLGACALLAAGVAAGFPLLHIAQLRARVAEAQIAVRQEQDRSRRLAVRAECIRRLADGRALLGRGSVPEAQEAQVLAATVQELIGDEDAQADPELAALRDDAARLRATAAARLRRLAGVEPSREQARRFLSLRDEAFFELHRDALAGLDARTPIRAAAKARQALAAFPALDHLPPAEADRLRAARREVWLVQAEATARGATTPAQLHEALALLRRVSAGAPMHGPHLLRARYLDRLGDPAGADRERRLAQARAPQGALDWLLVGHDHFQAGRTALAVAAFEHALAEQPDQFWGRLLRAVGCQQLGDLPAALVDLGLCVRQRPDFPWPYLLRAYLHVQVGQLARAQADLDRAAALPLEPAGRYVLHLNRGILELKRGRPRAAVVPFQHAILLQPARHHAHLNLALAYWSLRDLDRAAAVLDHAVRLGPDHPDLRRDRALLRRQRGDLDGALADLDALLRKKHGVTPADHVQRGRLLLERGRHADALGSGATALRLGGGAAAHRLHGEALLALGRPREAAQALSQAIVPGSTDAELFRLRAEARAKSNDLPGTVADYTLALAVRASAPLYRARGWAYLVQGAPRLARPDFEMALRLVPDDGDARAGRGSARVLLGEVAGGTADAAEALRRGPRTPRLLYAAARVFAQAAGADPRNAIRWCRQAVDTLSDALRAMPAGKRGTFWRDHVARDNAFDALTNSAEFARLARLYAPAR
jgi:tetratricopeptide (TPR) repeat protein